MTANGVLWVYVVLLVVGGAIGFFKAGSKISLVTSLAFATPLALVAGGVLPASKIFGIDFEGRRSVSFGLADLLILALLIVFAVRYSDGKKFMPSGLMLAASVVALGLRLFVLPR